MRVVEYLPGEALAALRPHSPELLQEIGALLGTVDRLLFDFQHPAACRELVWDARHAHDVIERHMHEFDGARQARMQAVLTLLQDSKPVLDALRTSVIHSDANDYNLIVQAPSAHAPFQPARLAGLIDFGDLLHCWTSADLAHACAYAMLGKADPLTAAAQVVAGYQREFAIPEQEIAAIFPLISARLALSVTLSLQQRRRQPDNEYLSISEAPAWALLDRLATVDPAYAHYRFRAACALEPCPTTPALTRWLRAHGAEAARILPEHDLHSARVLDFSVQSLEFGEQAGTSDPELWTEAVRNALRAASTSAGLGRYDEARPWYTSSIFQGESDGAPDWRSIHIGVDLFAQAGTSVAAPFAGVVHSFRNNAGRLDYGPTIILQHDVAPGITFYTLYGHLSLESLDDLRPGAAVQRGQRIGWLGTPDVNGGWSPHLHFQLITDMLGRSGEFPGVARPSERALWLSLAPDPNLVLRLPQLAPAPRVDSATVLSERRARIGPSLSIAYRNPLTILRGWTPAPVRRGRTALPGCGQQRGARRSLRTRAWLPRCAGRLPCSTPTRATCTKRSGATPND